MQEVCPSFSDLIQEFLRILRKADVCGGASSTSPEDRGVCGWVMHVEFEFKASAFRHGCSAQDIETAWRQWLTDFIEGDHPVKVVRLGFDQAGRLLEIGAHTLEDEGRVIVFHAMPARKRYTDAI